MKPLPFLPRLIRLRDAPGYLGMDRHRFNHSVRPGLTQVRIGIQGIAFDRLELDAWVDQLKTHHGRSGQQRSTPWDVNESPVCINATAFGTLTNAYAATDIAKARARVCSAKQKDS